MELKEDKDQWLLCLNEGRVNYIHIDFRLMLDFVDQLGTASLTIETPCRLTGLDADVSLTPSESTSLAPILPMFNTKVNRVIIRKTGQLKVEFEAGRFLEVDPDDAHEAWEISGSIGFVLVCSPGGAVSYFREDGGGVAM